MSYQGYQIRCGCTCKRCNRPLLLEGYSDAWGSHFCKFCNDYVPANESTCNVRTPEKVARREARIKAVGADKE